MRQDSSFAGLLLLFVAFFLVGGCVSLIQKDRLTYREAVFNFVGDAEVTITEVGPGDDLELLKVVNPRNHTVKIERLALYDKKSNRIYYVEEAP